MARIARINGSIPSTKNATGISKTPMAKIIDKPIAILLYLNGASIYVMNPPHKKVLRFPVILHSKIKALFKEIERRNPELVEMVSFQITDNGFKSPADTLIDYDDF